MNRTFTFKVFIIQLLCVKVPVGTENTAVGWWSAALPSWSLQSSKEVRWHRSDSRKCDEHWKKGKGVRTLFCQWEKHTHTYPGLNPNGNVFVHIMQDAMHAHAHKWYLMREFKLMSLKTVPLSSSFGPLLCVGCIILTFWRQHIYSNQPLTSSQAQPRQKPCPQQGPENAESHSDWISFGYMRTVSQWPQPEKSTYWLSKPIFATALSWTQLGVLSHSASAPTTVSVWPRLWCRCVSDLMEPRKKAWIPPWFTSPFFFPR